jgi:hypothetical protein
MISSFYKLEHSPGIKAGYALFSISGFFFLVFYIYEKTMIIFCGAGSPKENIETSENIESEEKSKALSETGPNVEEAIFVADSDKQVDEGAA